MGYDIYGVKAKTSTGEYFRNNVWWWRELWNYVCIIGQKENILTNKDTYKGGHNGGEKISKAKADKLAIALQKSIDDGTAALYEKKIKAMIFIAENTNKNLEPGDPNRDWNDNYEFEVTNLKEFTDFVKDSGGFQIC